MMIFLVRLLETLILSSIGPGSHQEYAFRAYGCENSFPHGNLEEQIYMEQAKGFNDTGNGRLVCKLKMSLYGLK